MTFELEPLDLSDGSRIVVVCTFPTMVVQRRRAHEIVDQVELPYPSAGLGGGRILASPSEHFALVSMFSGQSEEGYELLELRGPIRRVVGQGYQFGETASFCFSPDESALVMALPFACSAWWLPWDDGDVEPAGPGRFAFDFGQVRVQRLTDGNVSVATLRVSAAVGWSPRREHYDPDMHPRFLADGTLAVSLPWCDIATSLPLPETIFVPADT